MSLKKHLIENIERELTEELQRQPIDASANGSSAVKAHSRGERDAITEVKIADIVFSFNNQDLIFALRKRGGLIANNKFEEMRAQDCVINNLFMDFDKLTVPVSAFITFEEEDSKIVALRNNTHHTLIG